MAQIKDARELDDPYRRAEIVDEAMKASENKGERLRRAKAVKAYNKTRAEEMSAEPQGPVEAAKPEAAESPEAVKPTEAAKPQPADAQK